MPPDVKNSRWRAPSHQPQSADVYKPPHSPIALADNKSLPLFYTVKKGENAAMRTAANCGALRISTPPPGTSIGSLFLGRVILPSGVSTVDIRSRDVNMKGDHDFPENAKLKFILLRVWQHGLSADSEHSAPVIAPV